MKKTILAVLLTIVLSLFLPTAIMARAKDNEITISSCTLTTSSVKITGTTGAKAVMVRVKDESNNIIILQSFAVQFNDKEKEGTFSVNIEETLAEGTYTVSVADYEGGPWETTSVTVTESISSGSTSGGSTSGVENPDNTNQGGSSSGGGSGSTSSNAGESTITPGTSTGTTTVDDSKPVTAPVEIVSDKGEGSFTAKIKVGNIDEKPVEFVLELDPHNKKEKDLLNSLLTAVNMTDSVNVSVEITLSISPAKLNQNQKKETDKCVMAITEALTGKTGDNSELTDVLSKAGITADSFSGKEAGKTQIKPEIVIAKTYDFSLMIKVGEKAPVEIHDLGSVKMAVSFLIDKDLKNSNPDTLRKFIMIHPKDNGQTEILPVSVSNNLEATLLTGSYSPYVLAYVDVPRYTVAGDKLSSTKYNATYRIIEGGNVNGKIGTLEYIAPIKKKSSHTVVSKVTIDGITYKVKSISAGAFKGNEKVRKIKIGKYVTAIGSKAFYGCSSLKNVTIGKGISTIGAKAFYKATALENVIINSKKLKSTNIGKSIWTKAGKSGKGITFTVPSSKLKSYKKLFGKTGAVQAD